MSFADRCFSGDYIVDDPGGDVAAYNAAIAELVRLREQLAAARADTELLDWWAGTDVVNVDRAMSGR